MSKYKVGDKVVIRKDLKDGKRYGGLYWYEAKEYLKDKEYVTVEQVDSDGDYMIGVWIINEEMIECLYK